MWPAGENKGVSKPTQRSETTRGWRTALAGGLTAASAAGAGAVAMRESSVVGLVVVIAVATTISAVFALRLAARARAAESLALRDTLTGSRTEPCSTTGSNRRCSARGGRQTHLR